MESRKKAIDRLVNENPNRMPINYSPYRRMILEILNDASEEIRKICCMKAASVGFTQILSTPIINIGGNEN